MKLIILDRDGVINHDSDNYIKTVDEWQPIDGSIEAIANLTRRGFKIAVVTNQSGIARGFYDVNTLHAMHDKFRRMLNPVGGKIDAIFYCPHGPEDNCNCRKPKVGLYNKVESLFQTTLHNVFTVGDSYRDLESAMAVGSKPILVKTGKGLRTAESKKQVLARNKIPIYENLADFVTHCIE